MFYTNCTTVVILLNSLNILVKLNIHFEHLCHHRILKHTQILGLSCNHIKPVSVVCTIWNKYIMYILCSRCFTRTTVLLSYSISSHWLPQSTKGSDF